MPAPKYDSSYDSPRNVKSRLPFYENERTKPQAPKKQSTELTVYKSPSHDEYFKAIDDFYESPDKIQIGDIHKKLPFLSQSVTTKSKFKKALGQLSQNNRNTLMESAKHELDKRKSVAGIYYQDMTEPSATQGRQNYMR